MHHSDIGEIGLKESNDYTVTIIGTIKFEQKGNFRIKLQIAEKVDFSQLSVKNVKDLVFYSYDKETTKYVRIKDVARYIDKNGYVHFSTEKNRLYHYCR